MEPQQCWHLLVLVAYSLKPVKLLGPCKRTQHCWPTTPNIVGSCWYLLRPFAWAFILWQFHCLTTEPHQVNIFGVCSLSQPEHLKQKKDNLTIEKHSDVLTAYIYNHYRFNTLHVGSLFKVYECAVGAVGLHRFLGADATGFELVRFCFSQTECFSL